MSEILQQISQAVIEGNVNGSAGLVQAAIDSGLGAQEVLDHGLMAGMDYVGKEFKAQGYTHFTMKSGIPGYEDVRRNPAEWSMRLIAERDGYILCRIE